MNLVHVLEAISSWISGGASHHSCHGNGVVADHTFEDAAGIPPAPGDQADR
uniref:hypothetical protein n=1 Tax=Paenibacillus polymyxa TaxID=1406 RepID=UPI0035B63F15